MKKIIFLDIDGVLNSVDWYKRRTKQQQLSHDFELDVEAMHLYDEIVEKTGAKVVLSSTWRLSDTWRQDLERQGLNTNAIIDRTPRLPRPINTGYEYCERGKEIAAWLEEHPEVERYVILDDDSDMLQEQLLFQTSNQKGLTREIAQEVIKYLNK